MTLIFSVNREEEQPNETDNMMLAETLQSGIRAHISSGLPHCAMEPKSTHECFSCGLNVSPCHHISRTTTEELSESII